MHLVFLNQYYPPDAAPTGVMLEAVVERLVGLGHEVTVICAEGGYAKSGGRRAEGRGPMDQPLESAKARPPTANSQQPTVIRIRASRFGRGTFVGKLADYASYYLGAAWKLLVLHPRPDRIIALTTPPYLSILARLFSKLGGADHAHWVMDLYPDVMVAHGMLREESLKHRILRACARWGFGGGRCAAILTLGPDMAERVGRVAVGGGRLADDSREKLVPGDSEASLPTANSHPQTVFHVPLWGSGDRLAVGDGQLADNDSPHVPIQNPESKIQNPKSALRAKRGWRDDELIVMYSGNMGLGHRFGEFLEAAKGMNIEHRTPNLEPRSEKNCSSGPAIESSPIQNPESKIQNHQSSTIRFVFYGGGKRRVEIEDFIREHPDAPVELHNYAAAAELVEHLESADVHLASLDAAWTGTMVPSKLQGIFAVGRPVIFVGSPESSIGRWILESGGGWVVAPGDVDGLLDALSEARDPEARRKRGDAASDFAKQHFDRLTNASRVAEIFAR